ncbi:hypothetical protein SAMN04488072_1199 [Lentibacillus halodurans]|uniref:Uncharacterized protein n=1 Tax=Lentibacillus halodurans TaxID=237679 RepID=A0A1I1AHK6_9BACI|nr:hypothetical protein [Lentibacillus halodurans]SFB35978.1 hypothetical protein SAMN04488072_1199 [Lentibacillus halodurans]
MTFKGGCDEKKRHVLIAQVRKNGRLIKVALEMFKATTYLGETCRLKHNDNVLKYTKWQKVAATFKLKDC